MEREEIVKQIDSFVEDIDNLSFKEKKRRFNLITEEFSNTETRTDDLNEKFLEFREKYKKDLEEIKRREIKNDRLGYTRNGKIFLYENNRTPQERKQKNDRSIPKLKGKVENGVVKDVNTFFFEIFEFPIKERGIVKNDSEYYDRKKFLLFFHNDTKTGYINDDNEVVCINNFSETKYVVAKAKGNPENVLSFFASRFRLIEEQVIDLENEYDHADNKIELLGEINSKIKVLKKYNAFGDFKELASGLLTRKFEAECLSEENYRKKEEIIRKAFILHNNMENAFNSQQEFVKLIREWKQLGRIRTEKGLEIRKRWSDCCKNFFYKVDIYNQKNISEKNKLDSDLSYYLEDRIVIQNIKKVKSIIYKYKSLGKILGKEVEKNLNTSFYEKRDKYFEKVNREGEKNKEYKENCIKELESIIRERDYGKEENQQIKELTEEFKNVGYIFGNKEEDIRLQDKFFQIRKKYYEGRNNYYEKKNREGEKNKEYKENCIKELESIISSNDNWKEKDSQIKELTEEFKDLGYIFGDKEENQRLNNKFYNLKQEYFEEKQEYFEEKRKNGRKTKDKKESCIDELESIISSNDNWKEKDSQIKELTEEFKDLGYIFGDKEENQRLNNKFYNLKQEYFEEKQEYFEEKRNESIEWKKSKIEELQEKIDHWQDVIDNLNPGGKADEIEEAMNEKISSVQERIEVLEEEIEDLESR